MSAPAWPFGPGATICVSLAEPDAGLLQTRLEATAGTDVFEIRLDALADPAEVGADLAAALVERSSRPVGFTLRPAWQGGGWQGDESERRRLLTEIAGAGAAFVDVELDAAWAGGLIADAPCPVIASHHWDAPRPADLAEKSAAAESLAPSMVKLVATAAKPADALPLLDAAATLHRAGQPATCFCMGEAGRASRLLTLGHGQALIYAAAAEGSEVAPGQWPVDALVDELRVPAWQPGTGFCGLIGHPIGHSLSPAIFNAVFEEQGDPFAYLPVAGEDVDDVFALIEGTGFRGVSVTMPFKAAAAARAGRRDPVTEATGAANTLIFGDDGPAAYNTDGGAVVEAFAVHRPVDGARVAMVGAGGAARAGAAALVAAGAEVTIFNRTEARAAEAGALAGCAGAPLHGLRSGGFDVVVNATPVGMHGGGSAADAEATPFPVDWLSGTEIVFDMVYRPRVTALLRQAAERGCTTIEGLEMFVRQAAAQYRLLTGDPDVEPLAVMRAAAERVLRKDDDAANRIRGGGTDKA